MQISQNAMANPAVAPYLDHLALFRQVVHSMGIQDFSRFLLPQNVNVMPDRQMQRQVQQGNLIPMPGQMAAGGQGPQPQQNGNGAGY